MEEFPKTLWRLRLLWVGIALVVWDISVTLQYFGSAEQHFQLAVMRGSGLTAATLVGFILFISTLFKWFPRLAQFWRVRRYLGVSSAFIIIIHVIMGTELFYDGKISNIYYSFNPFENPAIFGSVGLYILLLLAATSSDFMVKKIGSRRWKNIHRLIYLGYIGIIFHFLQMNPKLYEEPAGIALYAVTILAVVAQLFWFVKELVRKKCNTPATIVGLALIALALFIALTLYT